MRTNLKAPWNFSPTSKSPRWLEMLKNKDKKTCFQSWKKVKLKKMVFSETDVFLNVLKQVAQLSNEADFGGLW